MTTLLRSLPSLVLPLSLTFAVSACGDDGSAEDGVSTTTNGTTGDGDPGDGDPGDGDPTTGDGDGDGENIMRWEIRMPDFSPPALLPTFYSCYAQTIEVPGDIHIIGIEPKITDNHVHHIVAQVLDTPTVDDPNELCIEDPWDEMLWGWAPGGVDLYLPPEAGVRAGTNGTVTIRFQVHYDNPLTQSFTDSGGFDVLYTDALRPNDAGVASFGDISGIFIPANDPAHEHVASCPSAFTQANFPGPLTVVATWLHAHEVGSVLWGEVVPADGGDAFELGRADPYDFDDQTFEPVAPGTVLMPGDEIQTHCVYDNSGNPNPVFGGVETSDEMCINFVLYYPKASTFDECGTL